MNKQEIISVIQKDIGNFDWVEFCPNGGWPIFDSLDLRIYSQKQVDDTLMVDADLLYGCKIPDGCFPGHINGDEVRKIIVIKESKLISIDTKIESGD